MRLLVVMADCPFPLRAGSAIICLNNIRELSGRHIISLVCRSKDCVEGKLALAGFASEIVCVNTKQVSSVKKIFFYAFSLILGIPVAVIMNRSPAMRRQVKAMTESGNFDAILLYDLSAIQYCPPSTYNKIVINIEDPQSIRLERMRKLSIWSLREKIKLFLHEKMFRRYERNVLPKMAKVLLLSESDVLDLRSKEGYGNVGYAPYGVGQNAQGEILTLEARTSGMIVFSGNMFHPPNVDGILFFLEKIYSFVLLGYPLATLWIVGATPDIRIHRAAAKFRSRVVITGKVEDISEYLRRAVVSICPVRLKIGVQTKILEALSWGTPVVTTSEGNSGIGGISGRELWVEDEPNDFANRVVALLHGDDWKRFSEGGRIIAEHFSWERSAAVVEKHLEYIHKECS